MNGYESNYKSLGLLAQILRMWGPDPLASTPQQPSQEVVGALGN